LRAIAFLSRPQILVPIEPERLARLADLDLEIGAGAVPKRNLRHLRCAAGTVHAGFIGVSRDTGKGSSPPAAASRCHPRCSSTPRPVFTSPFLSLISETQVQKTLSLRGQPKKGRLTPDITRQVCERTASAAILEGSIANLGNEYVLGLRARNIPILSKGWWNATASGKLRNHHQTEHRSRLGVSNRVASR
jgi:hypothetical protein